MLVRAIRNPQLEGLQHAEVHVRGGEVFLAVRDRAGMQTELQMSATAAKWLAEGLGDAAVMIERNGRLVPREGD